MDGSEAKVKRATHAPFVSKLWRMVNDAEANSEYIRWMPGGDSIQIVDRDAFEKKVLPHYFKHQRFSSFVRQLNMYGWHKVQDPTSGTMQAGPEENWQFQNPNFIKGREDLLANIMRNRSHHPAGRHDDDEDEPASNAAATSNGNQQQQQQQQQQQLNLTRVLSEIEQIKSRQRTIGEDLQRMRQDNELLWTEYYQTRERYDKHSQMLSRIMRFLASLYGNQLAAGPGAAGAASGSTGKRILGQSSMPIMEGYANDGESPIQELQELQELQDQIKEVSDMSGASDSTTPSSSKSTTPKATLENALVPVPSRRQSSIGGPSSSGAASSSTPQLNTTAQALQQLQELQHTQQQQAEQHNAHRQLQLQRQAQARAQNNQQTTPTPAVSLDDKKLASMPPPPGKQLVRASAGNIYNIPQPDDYGLLNDITASLDTPGSINDVTVPPLSQQDLDHISREIANNGSSLQSIQDWLVKQNPSFNLSNPGVTDPADLDFNVDDFLVGTPKTPEAISVDEPSLKRSRLA